MCHCHLPCTNLELVQKAVMSARLSSVSRTMSVRLYLVSSAAVCQLSIWQIVSSSVIFKLSEHAQLQSLGSTVTCQLSFTLSWTCRCVNQIWPQPHHQPLQGALISLSFVRSLWVPKHIHVYERFGCAAAVMASGVGHHHNTCKFRALSSTT